MSDRCHGGFATERFVHHDAFSQKLAKVRRGSLPELGVTSGADALADVFEANKVELLSLARHLP